MFSIEFTKQFLIYFNICFFILGKYSYFLREK